MVLLFLANPFLPDYASTIIEVNFGALLSLDCRISMIDDFSRSSLEVSYWHPPAGLVV